MSQARARTAPRLAESSRNHRFLKITRSGGPSGAHRPGSDLLQPASGLGGPMPVHEATSGRTPMTARARANARAIPPMSPFISPCSCVSRLAS